MAMGTPVVSTSIGCEGLAVSNGEHLLVADSPDAFADSILKLFRDPRLRATLAARGREVVRNGFGWDRIGMDLRRSYELVAEAGHTHRLAGVGAGTTNWVNP
jgi:glycosyltransferase involved in cell wall biosynthesis